MKLAYLDSSALVKTIVVEPESPQLKAWLLQRPERASCALVRTEVVRAVRTSQPALVPAAREALRGLQLIAVDELLLDAAADLRPAVRSLDAIHLAAAQALGEDLGALVTYDARMAEAARELGLPVVAP